MPRRAAAEDIAQEAFLAALARLDRFDRRRPLGPWLHRIAVNRAIDHVRARARAPRWRRRRRAAASAARPTRRRLGEDVVAALAALAPTSAPSSCCVTCWATRPARSPRCSDLPRGTVNSRLRRALDALAEALER